MKSLVLTLTFFLITLIPAFSETAKDPFLAYRDDRKPTPLTPRNLIHYKESEKLIIEKYKLNLSKKERSILFAFYWLIGFADSDANFDHLSTSFLLLFYEMTFEKGRKHQQEVARSILKQSLARGAQRLLKMYPKEESSLWKFLGLLHILVNYPEFEPAYHRFYQKQFAVKDPKKQSSADKKDFARSLSTKASMALYDQLVSTSFLHYYLMKVKDPLKNLPIDNFPLYLKKLESFEYKTNFSLRSHEFIDLGYLATHVLLVLTNYGEWPLKEGVTMRKAYDYIEATFDKAYALGYLDLYAEYIQSLKMVSPSNAKIPALESFLLDLQRSDGSWGNAHTLASDPYTAFHPTWAVLTALNQ